MGNRGTRPIEPNADPHYQIRAHVEVVEPMGSEVFLYLNTGKHTFTARVEAHDTADVNQELSFVLNIKKTHFFDHQSGQLIV